MELSVALLAAVLEAVRMQQVEPRAMGGDPNGWHRVTRPQRHVPPVPCSSWFVTRCQGGCRTTTCGKDAVTCKPC